MIIVVISRNVCTINNSKCLYCISTFMYRYQYFKYYSVLLKALLNFVKIIIIVIVDIDIKSKYWLHSSVYVSVTMDSPRDVLTQPPRSVSTVVNHHHSSPPLVTVPVSTRILVPRPVYWGCPQLTPTSLDVLCMNLCYQDLHTSLSTQCLVLYQPSHKWPLTSHYNTV